MSAKYLWVALFVVFGCLSSLRAQPSDNFYVDPAAPSGGDGSSWATAFQTIAEAVRKANETVVDDRIWLAPGIHQPTGPMAVVHPCTVGAPLGTATIDYSGVLASFRVLDTDIHFTGVNFSGAGRKVVGIGHHSGIRFTRCEFRGSTSVAVRGDRCYVMWFDKCEFSGNSHWNNGGAIQGVDCVNVDIEWCKFEQNTSYQNGGAVFLQNCDRVNVHESVFKGNVAHGSGGGLHVEAVNITPPIYYIPKFTEVDILNTEFVENEAWQDGGGIRARAIADFEITNGVLLENTSCGSGGGLKASQYPVGGINRMVLLNCTVTKNMAVLGGGISLPTPFTLPNTELLNSILWDNSALSAGTILEAQCDLEPRNVDHCCIQDWGALSWSGYAINSDPRLRSNGKIGWLSPCIDAGDVSLYPGMNSDPYNRRNYDVEGRDRVQGIEIDMGAFEVEPLRVFEGPFVHFDVDIRP